MAVPVILPVQDAADKIEATLECLEKQREPVETIIIDRGSKDDTVQIAKNLGHHVLKFPEKSKLDAIKIGLKLVGPQRLTLLTNTNSRPSESWAETMAQKVDDYERLTLLTGKVDYIYPKTIAGVLFGNTRKAYQKFHYKYRELTNLPVIPVSGNMGFLHTDEEFIDSVDSLHYTASNSHLVLASHVLKMHGSVEMVKDNDTRLKAETARCKTFKSAFHHFSIDGSNAPTISKEHDQIAYTVDDYDATYINIHKSPLQPVLVAA